MKYATALLLAGLALRAQSLPIAVGPTATLSVAAVDDAALTALVSSSVSPDGQIHMASDLYLLQADGTAVRQLTNLTNFGAPWVDLAADGSKVAYSTTSAAPSGKEEIHVVDTASGSDLKVAVDTAGCVLPLASAVCYGCIFTCVRSVHFSPDASKVVYSASENQSLYVVNADGSGVLHLPVSGAVLAPSPQRVVSRNGLLVFTTNQDVDVVRLDGSGVQTVASFPPNRFPTNATISEDGNSIAFQLQDTHANIYVVQFGNPAVRLTHDTVDAINPAISGDGRLIAFLQANQIYIQPADAGQPPARLTNFSLLTPSAVTLNRDGTTALVKVDTGIYSFATGSAARKLFTPRAVLSNGITSYSGLAAPTPGSLFRIMGWNFGDDTAVSAGGFPLPESLGGVSVNLNGQPIALLSVTPSQITGQMPFTIAAGTADVIFDFADGQHVTATATVKESAPELLQVQSQWFNISPPLAMIFHADSWVLVDPANPAVAGETLVMYGIGLGAVNGAMDAGMPGPSNPPLAAMDLPQVRIGNQNATVTFAGLAPGLVGIYQVNVVVPGGLKSGNQPISWSVKGQPPQVTWNLSVK